MRFVLTIGTTATARINGLSAAGAAPELLAHTPAADAEILAHGRPRNAPVLPVSPTGCPTPAVVTRAGRERLGFDVDVVDAGAAEPADVTDVTLPGGPGADIREPVAVPEAKRAFEAAREYGRGCDEDRVVLAETIPGGTTTAMATLTALGERPAVSSSLPENPLDRKRRVVDAALDASDLTPGEASDDPLGALRAVGDPVLAGVAGVAAGALESGTRVTLAGGTQLSAVAALVRAFGVDGALQQATTSFVADDESADVGGLATELDVDLTVTDPLFAGVDHPMTTAYCRGEAKEGVGMGGVLAVASGSVPGVEPDASVAAVRDRAIAVYDRLVDEESRTGGPEDGAPTDDPVDEGPPDDSADDRSVVEERR